ncbi:MAG: AAA family ATPase [Dermatophilaceae bacterium]
MVVPLRSLEVSGLTSIERLKFTLSSDITVLVGANGAGKSNLVNAFEFLGRLLDGKLNDHVLRVGGFSSLLHRSTVWAEQAESIRLEAWGEERESLRNGYRADIQPGPGDSALVAETTQFHDTANHPKPWSQYLGLGTESQLREHATTNPTSYYALDVLAGCRVFHFDDTSPDAPPKRRVDMADNLTLHPDAGNIAAVLLKIRDDDEHRYRRIIRAVRTVAPFVEDFVLEPQSGSLLLRWSERGLDGTFSADALSDGTLRFICLAVLLLQPNPPSTIVLDEPELGLHPFAIHQLASLMRAVGEARRVVAATQSVTLLGQFGVDEVAVVERTERGTVVSRPNPGQLDMWLRDYSLGELWEKNLLGGRPGPARPVSGP